MKHQSVCEWQAGKSSARASVFAERIESKFLITEQKAREIESRILEELPREKFPDNKDGIIGSIYFDNTRFLCYKDQINGKQGRFKIRFRKYGDSAEGFWEIKEKWGDTVYKDRAPVMIGDLLENGFKEDWDGIDGPPVPGRILDRIKQHKLLPILVIRQQRNAYEDHRGKFRVTFDRLLRARPLLQPDKKEIRLLQDHVVIMEMKRAVTDMKDRFASALRREFNLEELGFSKYCRAVDVIWGKSAEFSQWRILFSRGAVKKNDSGNVWQDVGD